ncbi:NAD(P)-dependent dehydrogenase, short-chain alcohol dehydrogenase family [Ruminococcaceae bacterium D5]|nr:NAD(P)-dependent dehydrogenase, short-chain alcohol dehydrogenase family [Ruminococcaceae bacterium D5]
MGRLEGKVAIITGAGGGFGRRMSEIFSQEGAKIVVADFDEKSGRETVEKVVAAGGDAIFVKVDVTNDESTRNMVAKTVEQYGKLDILVNNAGKQGVKNDIAHMQVEEMMPYLNVNVRGPWLCIHHAALELVKTKGKIVNIASIAALQGSYGGTAYGVSKGAVLSLTYAVANELGLYGVRCNAVSPYSAATQETVRLLGEEFHELRKSGNPLHQLCIADDVAYASLFLASDESRSCTGLNLLCDCGAHVRSCPFDIEDFKKNNVYEGVEPLF